MLQFTRSSLMSQESGVLSKVFHLSLGLKNGLAQKLAFYFFFQFRMTIYSFYICYFIILTLILVRVIVCQLTILILIFFCVILYTALIIYHGHKLFQYSKMFSYKQVFVVSLNLDSTCGDKISAYKVEGLISLFQRS